MPGPKNTLMVEFQADRFDLSDLKIEKYINAIELMDDEIQVIRYSEVLIEQDYNAEARDFNENFVAKRYPVTPCFAIEIPMRNYRVIVSINIRFKKSNVSHV